MLLQLRAWDLLRAWAGNDLYSRLGLQMVNEAALCVTGIRQRRSLPLRGFELANGLPFLADDGAIHNMLNSHTIDQSVELQVALGNIRRTLADFEGNIMVIDPHRVASYSKRHMSPKVIESGARPTKTAQTFFCLDADTGQPVAMTSGSSCISASDAAINLIPVMERILGPSQHPLILLDNEHLSAKLFDQAATSASFDLLCPMPRNKALLKTLARIPEQDFQPRWAGFATFTQPYQMANSKNTFHQIIQRCGERPEEYAYKAFLATTNSDPVQALTHDFPKRWTIEEFFRRDQHLGWNIAGTMNLHIRYAKMTMAMVAQAAVNLLRKRLGEPWNTLEAKNLSMSFLRSLEGDIRVHDDTILITYYNAKNVELLKNHFEKLPFKLTQQGIDPRIPWLYDFKLDFRFR